MKTIAMVLSPRVADSQVLVDGVDVSSCVQGVEVSAWVGEPVQVTLHLVGRVELMADVDQVTYSHPGDQDQGDGVQGQGTDRGKKGMG